MSVKTRTRTIPVYRLQLVEDGRIPATAITGPGSVAAQCTALAKADREQMLCLHLNTKHWPIGRQLIGIGTLDSTLIHPREVFKAALLSNAAAILLVHNHPSGDPTPSRDDDEITQMVVRAGAILGVKLLDHVIVAADGKYYSYQEEQPLLLMADSGAVLPGVH